MRGNVTNSNTIVTELSVNVTSEIKMHMILFVKLTTHLLIYLCEHFAITFMQQQELETPSTVCQLSG